MAVFISQKDVATLRDAYAYRDKLLALLFADVSEQRFDALPLLLLLTACLLLLLQPLAQVLGHAPVVLDENEKKRTILVIDPKMHLAHKDQRVKIGHVSKPCKQNREVLRVLSYIHRSTVSCVISTSS